MSNHSTVVRPRGSREKPLLLFERLKNSCPERQASKRCWGGEVARLHTGCARTLQAGWSAYSVYNSVEEEYGTFRKLHKLRKAERGARRRTQQDTKLKGRFQITTALWVTLKRTYCLATHRFLVFVWMLVCGFSYVLDNRCHKNIIIWILN